MEIKPIKRSKELAPLSREHHDGLLFIWKIKQGLANGTSIETLCNYTLWFWSNHIKPHFRNEEQALIRYLPAENALVQQMLKEHSMIRDLVLSLDKEPDPGSLQLLVNLMNDHIRFEERQLFAYAEEYLTPEQLDEIYKEFPHDPHCDTEWKEQFWVKR